MDPFYSDLIIERIKDITKEESTNSIPFERRTSNIIKSRDPSLNLKNAKFLINYPNIHMETLISS